MNASPKLRLLGLAYCALLGLHLPSHADDLSQGWSLSVGCPESGDTSDASTFAGTTTGGFSGSGTCQRTSTSFTKFAFTSSSGGSLNSSTIYGMHTGDVLVVPPTLSTETKPIFMVTPKCPVSDKSLNWIFAQWHATSNHTLASLSVVGRASYSTSSGISVTNSYDVHGTTQFSGSFGLAGSCTDGVYTLSGSGDRGGSVYFALNGAGSFKASSSKATLFIPVHVVSAATDLGSKTFPGMIFDSASSSTSKSIQVQTNAAGTTWTIRPYDDVETGTISNSYTDTVAISDVNSPGDGFVRGTVTRTGAGAGTGDIICVVSRAVATRAICSGETPSNNNIPYSMTFALEGPQVFGQPSGHENVGIKRGLNQPNSTFVLGTKLLVADTDNNRVLIYNTLPTGDGPLPNTVVGQSTLLGTAANSGGISAASLNHPRHVYSDGTKLFIADTDNNRVLIWNTIPTSNGVAADVVLGQPNMTSSTANNGGIASTSLYQPSRIFTYGTKLFVSDHYNHRVLIWNTIPTSNQTAANTVLGQSNMTSNDNNDLSFKIGHPMGIWTNGTKLFITATNEHRVVGYNSMPTSNGAAPDIFLGQSSSAGYSQNAGGSVAANTNYIPKDITSNGTKLIVADTDNHRILIWNTLPTATQQSADVVLGQSSFTAAACNNVGTGAGNLCYPYGIHTDGTRLIASDTSNNRVVIWNSIPTSNTTNANIAVGQPNLDNGQVNGGVLSGKTLTMPWGATTCNGKFIVSDCGNHRVLIWNSLPTVNYAAADVVLGQASMTTNYFNYGGGQQSNNMTCANSVSCDGTRLIVADWSNNRVLIWNTIPTVNQTAADVVVGQANMNSGGAASPPNAASLNGPAQAYSDGTRLYVADFYNNRVLIWNSMPSSNGTSANVVLGQPDFATTTAAAAATGLNLPAQVYAAGGKLYVSDPGNNRVLIWNSIPSSNQTAANVVLGQSTMTGSRCNEGGLSGATMCSAEGMFTVGTKLFVADSNNNRVLGWKTIPTSNGATADFVIGQPNLTTNTANYGGLSSGGFNCVPTVTSDGTRLFVVDAYNNRIVTLEVP